MQRKNLTANDTYTLYKPFDEEKKSIGSFTIVKIGDEQWDGLYWYRTATVTVTIDNTTHINVEADLFYSKTKGHQMYMRNTIYTDDDRIDFGNDVNGKQYASFERRMQGGRRRRSRRSRRSSKRSTRRS